MNDSATVIEEGSEILTHPFVKQMVMQLRAIDSYGTYDTWSDARVIDPVILTKERRREIPVIGDPDETVISRVKAYYNGISQLIEKETGLMAVPFINITHEGFGRALIVVGRLVVLEKTLRDVHRFGFSSPEKMIDEVDKLVKKAVDLVKNHQAAAEL